MKKLLFAALFFATGLLCAQTNFKPGYIIAENNDTLYGEIDYRGDLLMGTTCRFRQTKGAVKTNYLPGEIQAFRFIGSKYFVSREIGRKKAFLEFLVKGEVSLFYLRDETGEHYYIEKTGEPLTEIRYEEGTIYRNNTSCFYQTNQHIGILKVFMKDAPSLAKEIEEVKKPSHENLIKVAKDYHNLVCPGNDCIIYEKPVPFLKMNIEVAGGIINYQRIDSLDGNNFFRTGVFAHLWMPRWNENMYFRTGISYAKLSFENGDEGYYKIPLQFEYVFPKGLIRPRFAYGYTMYLNSGTYMSLDGGLNILLSDKLFLDIAADLEFESKAVIPGKKLSHTFYAGFVFKL